MPEEEHIAIERSADAVHHFGREIISDFGEHAAHEMISEKPRAVGAGKQRYEDLNAIRKLRNGHIRAADKTVNGTYDDADGGAPALRLYKKAYDGRESRTEQRQQKYVENDEKRVACGNIPAYAGKIDKTCAERHVTDGGGDGGGRQVIRERKIGFFVRRHRKIADRARHFILHDLHIGAKRDRDATHRQKRRKKPAADKAFDDFIGHNDIRGNVFFTAQVAKAIGASSFF